MPSGEPPRARRRGPRAAPALRRGCLIAVPVAVSLAIEFGLGAPTKGAIATGALLAGFPGIDAPAGVRARWQALAAPAIGVAATLGVLSSQATLPAALAMGVAGAGAGYCLCVSARLALAGLAVALSMLVAQGLFLSVADAWPALLYATAGGLLQALWSLLVWVGGERSGEPPDAAWDGAAARRAVAASLSLSDPVARHAIRFGCTLAVGVAAYRLLGMHNHGFWLPLTILFVMRPGRAETFERLGLRAVGTALGLVLATAVAELLGGERAVVVAALSVSAALSFGLLRVQYALFTAAITTYVVLLTDTFDEGALEAAGQRALGTGLGILLAGLAFVLWPDRGRGAAPEGAAR